MRGFVRVAVWAILIFVPVSSASWSWSYDIDRKPLDESYFNGYLTWNAGKGGIAWQPGAASEEWGNPTPDSNAATIRSKGVDQGWQAKTELLSSTVAGSDLIPVDTFVSAPTPHTLHLNTSRGLWFDLYLKSGACPKMELELWMGETLVGGSIADVRMIDGKFYYSAPESGTCGHPFGLHLEVDTIPAGSVLTLKLYQFQPTNPIYALKDRNVLRIPVYSPEELVLRSGDVGQANLGNGSNGTPVPLLGAAAAPLVLLGARRRRVAPTLLLLAFAPLAGCIGDTSHDTAPGSATPTGGHVESTLVAVNGTQADQGSIVGLVHDEYNLPVRGAHIALFGTSFFGETNQYGGFTFTNISAGSYQMRIDHQGFKSLETNVLVQAGKVTRLDITLMPLVAKTGGFRPHQHDYWAPGETSRVVFTGPVRFADQATTCDEEEGIQNFLCYADFRLPVESGKRNLILPGTRDIEVKIHWDQQENRVARAGVLFETASNLSTILMYPRGPDSPIHIQTGWGMNDFGHSTFSAWRLAIYVSTNSNSQRPTSQYIGGPFGVEVKIHRGTIPLEPPHRDFWQNNTTLQVVKGADATKKVVPTLMIPPGTAWLEAVYEQSRSTKQTYAMDFRPANEPAGAKAARFLLKETSRTATKVTYRQEITPVQSDPFYAKKSLWEFGRIVTNADTLLAEEDGLDVQLNGAVTATFNVMAFKDPAYKSGGEE